MSHFPKDIASKITQVTPPVAPPPKHPTVAPPPKHSPVAPPPKHSSVATESDPPTNPPVPAPAPASGLDENKIEIELGGKKDEVEDKKTINLKGSEFFDKEIDKKTSEARKREEPKKVKTPEEKAITEEKVVDKKLEPEDDDYEMVAEFLIEMLDLGTSTALRWWAMDSSDAPYEMTVSKKKKLGKIGGEVLKRMNKKFPLAVLFLITLAIALYTPVKKANEMRRKQKGLAEKKAVTGKKKSEKVDKEVIGKKPWGGKKKVVRRPGGTSK